MNPIINLVNKRSIKKSIPDIQYKIIGPVASKDYFDYLKKIREEFPVLNDRNPDAYRLN